MTRGIIVIVLPLWSNGYERARKANSFPCPKRLPGALNPPILKRMTSTQNIPRIHRARGALLGLAVGDAIGTTVEFKLRGSFEPLTDMVGGGPFGLQAGQFTDDTSMALCLGASLVEKGFDLHDQMTRYVRWANEGYMSSNGRCFDIGIATRGALQRFKRDGDPLAGSTDPHSAGNGCIMRLAPIPIRYMDQPELAVRYSAEQARTTHQAPECLGASRLFGELLVRALQGKPKEEVLAPHALAGKLPTKLEAIGQGHYRSKSREAIWGTGYVVDSLEATLWCFDQTDNFRDCILMAANLGDDADTTAAQAGQLAGAFYGESGIPVEWLGKLAMMETIRNMADALGSSAGDSK
jgi:ADP-ribosyl-[dinitrogen reductase] hydrolase